MSTAFERCDQDELQEAAGDHALIATKRGAEELLHDLQVHQIELEMQNETLRQAQIELEKSRDRYMDIYDFAPVGYLLLTADATIAEINLTGAALLGVERGELLKRSFLRFVSPQDSDRWHRYFLELLKINRTHVCELLLQRGDASHFYAELNCRSFDADHNMVRITLTDISERRQAEIELREYQQLLHKMAAQNLNLREVERKHFAREVHDELGSLLTALRINISLLRIQFGGLDPALLEKTIETLALVDKAIQGARNVAHDLRPAVLDLGIVPAIGWLCDNFHGNGDTACTLLVDDAPSGLDEAQTLTIFRVVQESLTNIARHAEADGVRIAVGRCGDEVRVEVRDDGKGFDIADLAVKKSFGLLGMRERALAVGGKVEIVSAPSEGTVVSIRIPTNGHGDLATPDYAEGKQGYCLVGNNSQTRHARCPRATLAPTYP